MRIKYQSNNSGGRWWLSDSHWEALRAAGWVIHDFVYESDQFKARVKATGKEPIFDPTTFWSAGRYMGALAKSAHKEFETPGDAMREFEKLTGMEVSDEGCNCCGAPHSFYWGRGAAETDEESEALKDAEYGSANGEECLEHLFGPDQPKSLREAIEQSRKGHMLKVGDRVAVYVTPNEKPQRRTGQVTGLPPTSGGVQYKDDKTKMFHTVHRKQVRRLKKRERVRAWIMHFRGAEWTHVNLRVYTKDPRPVEQGQVVREFVEVRHGK